MLRAYNKAEQNKTLAERKRLKVQYLPCRLPKRIRDGHANAGNANIRPFIRIYCQQYAPICANMRDARLENIGGGPSLERMSRYNLYPLSAV